MLSRVAERLYWLARYLERAENTARLANVYSALMLDLPPGVGVHWRQLVEITGGDEQFHKRHRTSGERNALKFILLDTTYGGSLLSSLSMARENVRTSRDQIPSEAFESVNELLLFARRKLNPKIFRKNLYESLSQVVMHCQQITGLLAGSMSHGFGYQFVRLGRNLERADMTTRLLDVGSATLIAESDERTRLENRLWINILRSLSAHQMYRLNVRRRVKRENVVDFLLRDLHFPRAVAHTLAEVQACLEQLPKNDMPLRSITRVRRHVAETESHKLVGEALHRFIDELQLDLAETHGMISKTWFLPVADDEKI